LQKISVVLKETAIGAADFDDLCGLASISVFLLLLTVK